MTASPIFNFAGDGCQPKRGRRVAAGEGFRPPFPSPASLSLAPAPFELSYRDRTRLRL